MIKSIYDDHVVVAFAKDGWVQRTAIRRDDMHLVLCEKCRKVKEDGVTVYKGTLVQHLCRDCLAELHPDRA